MAFAVAALGEPGGQALGKTLRSETKAGFKAAIGDGESVVKVGGVGEIAHGELIEPLKRARPPLAANQDVYLEFLGIHKLRIALPFSGRLAVGRTGCEGLADRKIGVPG